MVSGSNLGGARISASIQTSPGAHPSPLGLRGWGVVLTTPSHLVPMLKKEWRPTCSASLFIHDRLKGEVHFYKY